MRPARDRYGLAAFPRHLPASGDLTSLHARGTGHVAALWRLGWSAALLLASVATAGTVRFTFTAPTSDANGCLGDTSDVVWTIDGVPAEPPLTGLDHAELWAIRYHDMSTILVGTIPLSGRAGDSITVDAEFLPGTMGQAWVLAVDPAGNKMPCPGSWATFVVPDTAGPVPIPPVPSGSGLVGTYFAGQAFDAMAMARVDSTVNFNWGESQAWSGGPTDNFSIRWTGTVSVPAAGSWTFFVASDDGIRLWIDGAAAQDDWRPRWDETANTVTLAAGPHSIRLEYFEAGGGALCQLRWAGPGVTKQIIPKGALSH